MMRVIITEAYLNDPLPRLNPRDFSSIGNDQSNDGVAYAWFNRPSQRESIWMQNVADQGWFEGVPIRRDQLELALEFVLLEAPIELLSTVRSGRPVRADVVPYVNFVFEQKIVVEQSPPSWTDVLELVKAHSAHVAIGTIIGFAAAGGNPLLLYITVPGGILVIGTTMSVTKALMNGLNKKIGRMFDD